MIGWPIAEGSSIKKRSYEETQRPTVGIGALTGRPITVHTKKAVKERLKMRRRRERLNRAAERGTASSEESS